MKLMTGFFLVLTGVCFGQDLNQGLVGYFPFNGNANDESTTNIDGTVYNAIPTNGVGDVANGSYYYNGTNAYIDLGNNNRTITNVVSISFWIKTTSMGMHAVLTKYDYSQDKGYAVFVNNGVMSISGRDGSGIYRDSGNSTTNIADGTWHHVLGVVNENTWEIWVDCNLENFSVNTTIAPGLQNSDQLSVGYWYFEGMYFFDGMVDEVRVYNRVLTPGETNLLCDYNQFVGTEEVMIPDYKLSIYPNPCTDLLKIEAEEIQCVEIYNAAGVLVYQEGFENQTGQTEINIKDFADGIYIIRVRYTEGIRSERFIISH